MAVTLAPNTRKIVAKLVASLPSPRADADTIFELLMASHADILAQEQREINRLAVGEMLSRVSMRRGRANIDDDNQIDFWRQNSLRCSLSVTDNAGKKLRKSPYEMTFDEAERYIDDHTMKRDDMSKTVRTLAEAIEDLREFAVSPTMTLGDCWRVKRAAEAA